MEVHEDLDVVVNENTIQTHETLMLLMKTHCPFFDLNNGVLHYMGKWNTLQQVQKALYRLRGRRLIYFRATKQVKTGFVILPALDDSGDSDDSDF